MVQLPGVLGHPGPVHVAPMAGGPTSPALVVAAARAGSFAQLAAGYTTPDTLGEQIAVVRAAGVTGFGVNLFTPNPVPIDPRRVRPAPSTTRAGGPRRPPGPTP